MNENCIRQLFQCDGVLKIDILLFLQQGLRFKFTLINHLRVTSHFATTTNNKLKKNETKVVKESNFFNMKNTFFYRVYITIVMIVAKVFYKDLVHYHWYSDRRMDPYGYINTYE